MRLDRLQLKGYKSIREMDLPLRSLNLLIGANGSGKSNLISAFALLNNVVEERLQMSVAKAGGAATLLHNGPKVTQQITMQLHFDNLAYRVTLEHAPGDTLFFAEEVTTFQAWKHERSLGAGYLETKLVESVRQAGAKSRALEILAALASWRVYHFHDTSPTALVKQKGPIDDNRSLRSDAGNLAAFLFRLQETAADAYRRIVAAVQQVAPFFHDFRLRPDPAKGDVIQLEWEEKGSDNYFNAHALSDGTLRFICLATLLLQPNVPDLVVIDEPELGLHPYAINQLAALFRGATATSQLLIATQSVTLMNQFQPEDIVVVDRDDGQSTFRRVTEAEIATWAEEYALGDIWEKNVIGGRPRL